MIVEITQAQIWLVVSFIGAAIGASARFLYAYINKKFKECNDEKKLMEAEIVSIKAQIQKTTKPTMIRDFEGKILSVNTPLMNQLFRKLGYASVKEILGKSLRELKKLSPDFINDLERGHDALLLDPYKPVIRTGVKASESIMVGFYKSMYEINSVEYFETEFSINSN
jgi:hypothetical protein